MVHFEFTLSEEDAETLFEIIQNEIDISLEMYEQTGDDRHKDYADKLQLMKDSMDNFLV